MINNNYIKYNTPMIKNYRNQFLSPPLINLSLRPKILI
jgi:hypothetical protein